MKLKLGGSDVGAVLSRQQREEADHGMNFFFNPLFVTICPEPFSNLCVDSAGGMQETLPVKFSHSILNRED